MCLFSLKLYAIFNAFGANFKFNQQIQILEEPLVVGVRKSSEGTKLDTAIFYIM